MADWAKMADDLDRNRKIRKGGRNAREVFLWVLRKVAAGNTSGWVKAEDFDDLEYLADELMTPVTDVTDGVTRCIDVGLLFRDGDKVCVSGWDGQWEARKPRSNAERQQSYRERKKSSGYGGSSSPPVTGKRNEVTESVTPDVTNNGSNERNAVEESRGEERERSDARESDRRVTPAVTPHVVTLTPNGPSLATKLWNQQSKRYAELNARLGLDLPGLQLAGHAVGWRDLRDRIAGFAGELERAEQACLHVLDVREAEAAKKRDLQYFGDKVWREDQFSHALSSKRPVGSRASPRDTPADEPESEPYLDWLPKELTGS